VKFPLFGDEAVKWLEQQFGFKPKTETMIVIKKSKDKKSPFYWVVLARNKKVLLTSETYRTRNGCKKGIASLVKVLNGIVNIVDETKSK